MQVPNAPGTVTFPGDPVRPRSPVNVPLPPLNRVPVRNPGYTAPPPINRNPGTLPDLRGLKPGQQVPTARVPGLSIPSPGAPGTVRLPGDTPPSWQVPQSRPRVPAKPRSPGVNPRFPRWARNPWVIIPGIGGVLGVIPTVPDLLFGIIPDEMERRAPEFWDWIGYKPPGSDPAKTTLPHGGHAYWYSNANPVNRANIYGPDTRPFTFWIEPHPTAEGRVRDKTINWAGTEFTGGMRDPALFTAVYEARPAPGAPQDPPVVAPPNPTFSPIQPNAGVQPGTRPNPLIPTRAPGTRPTSDPRGYRPDLASPPRLSPDPRGNPNPDPRPDNPSGLNCQWTESERQALAQILGRLNAIESKLDNDGGSNPQTGTLYSVPYVVETTPGERSLQQYTLLLQGTVETGTLASLSNQTANWALEQGEDKSERVYQILGGDATWGNQPQPQLQTNPDELIRQTPAIDSQGNSQNLVFATLPALITGIVAAMYLRMGLQRFPLTQASPQLNAQGLIDDDANPRQYIDATDVTVTSSSRGWAIVKGMNEVITRTRQTIQWLRIDRLLNLMTFATTMHNALMLSNALGQTLGGIIDNVLATFGFALQDASGNPIGVGELIQTTVSNMIKAVVGEANFEQLQANFAKANRIYQASMNLLFSLQSISYSILGALEVVGSWVAWIGNALKRFGALTEKAYPWMNPSPDFQNPAFTKLQEVSEILESLEVITSETRSATETIQELDNQAQEITDNLRNGTEKPGVENLQQQGRSTTQKAQSNAPIIPPFELVRPEQD